MSVEVKIPTVLRKHTNDQAVLAASGSTIRELIEDIASTYPDFREKVLAEGGELQGLDTKVSDGDSVAILPAVAGG
jgi:molybdopterin synthase sulfur carrier subunit